MIETLLLEKEHLLKQTNKCTNIGLKKELQKRLDNKIEFIRLFGTKII